MRASVGVRRVKWGVGGSHSSSVSDDPLEDDPADELRQNRQPAQVELERDELWEEELEDELLDPDELRPPSVAGRLGCRRTLLHTARRVDRADLAVLFVRLDATDLDARRRRRSPRGVMGVYRG